MLKKLTTLLLLCAVLAACTPKNSNDSQKYADLSVDQIPSFEEYSQSVEFVAPGEDSFTYLSVEFVKENGEGKVSSYGLEK